MAITLDGTTGITTPDLAVDTNTLFVDAASNRVGIGATTLDAPLTIKNPSVSGDQNILTVQNGAGTDALAKVVYNQSDDSMKIINAATSTGSHMGFWTRNAEQVRIDASGSLLVGATTANAKLDVTQATSDATNGLTLRGYTTGSDGARTFNINTVSSDLNNWANLNLKAQQFTFSIQGTERARIDASGHLIVPAGITLGTAAGVYNAANTLDDYEEGTWTPVIRGSSAAGSYPLSVATGSYTKVGRFVNVSLRIIISSVSSAGSGYMQITGLPFVKANNNILSDSAVRLRNTTGITSYDWPTLEMVSQGSTDVAYIFCNQVNSVGFDLPVGGVQANTEISGHLFYEV